MRFLIDNVVAPLSRRVGTAAGSTAAALGATVGEVAQTEAAVAFLCGLGIDLLLSRVNRVSLIGR